MKTEEEIKEKIKKLKKMAKNAKKFGEDRLETEILDQIDALKWVIEKNNLPLYCDDKMFECFW